MLYWIRIIISNFKIKNLNFLSALLSCTYIISWDHFRLINLILSLYQQTKYHNYTNLKNVKKRQKKIAIITFIMIATLNSFGYFDYTGCTIKKLINNFTHYFLNTTKLIIT